MSKGKVSTKTLEERYKKIDPHEHVLLRPDMYIGTVKETTGHMWVYNKEGDSKMVYKEISYVPGLYKIFDEILVNAADQKTRCKMMNMIKVNIDKDSGKISVWNNGAGVPVEEHKEQKEYIPTMIFGTLLSGENFDDDEDDAKEKRITGGKNGLGAKLANIYSTEFIVETCDGTKNFKQVFNDNMYKKGKPTITAAKKAPFTKITFTPDFARFKLDGFTDDIFALFQKRVYDIAMTTGVKVYFNDEAITPLPFQKYVDLYFPEDSEHKKVVEMTSNPRWKICVVFDPLDNMEHQNISFVNSICTHHGGTHVEHVSSQIVAKLKVAVEKKAKGITVKANQIKENLIFFVDSTIELPEFDGQTKDMLKSKVAEFGSKYVVTEALIKKIIATGVVDQIIENARSRAESNLAKQDGSKKGVVRIDKLFEAHQAGKKEAALCTLMLTEGDSAKAFAMAGFNETGRDHFGVFPLRGKLKNVRKGKDDANIIDTLEENKEIKAIREIMGLVRGKKYTSVEGLRYGKIAVLTDADSVTGDTPLLLKDIKDQIDIRTIETLSNDWFIAEDGKEYSLTDYEIWTEQGWTKIVKVIRHKINKSIYRVLSHTGIVDVTQDHSLLDVDSNKISPKDCKVGDHLLHSFPKFDNTNIPSNFKNLTKKNLQIHAKVHKIYGCETMNKSELIREIGKIHEINTMNFNYDSGISTDEALLMGFFWADGTCGIYKFVSYPKSKDGTKTYTRNRTNYSWSLSNLNLGLLEKFKKILEKLYDYSVTIVTCHKKNSYSTKDIYKLVVNGGKKILPLVEKYRSMFYDKNKKKKIPQEILNAPHDVRKNFIEGFYQGDGLGHDLYDSQYGRRCFAVDGKIGAQGIFFLCKSLGYDVSINHDIEKPKVYRLFLTDGKQRKNPNAIKKIFNLGQTEQYVYDLETENHHFQSGIGETICHNTDGSHIKGLIMSYIHHYWPSLLKINGFIECLTTPVVKLTKGKGVKQQSVSFYNLNELELWKKKNNDGKGWDLMYYKGLGTNGNEEARECFTDYNDKTIKYCWKEKLDEDDTDNTLENYEPKCKDICEDAITLAFAKKRENDRKDWMNLYDENLFIDNNRKNVSYAEFIHKELIAFSVYNVARAVPNIMDGFKPSQRKIYFGCVKKNIYNVKQKVSQLSGYIAEKSAYHHGDTSLQEAIIGMAQTFVGSNNLNLLVPVGQFGTRLSGGHDSASPRYIFTMLSDIGKTIFVEHDNNILDYLTDDGEKIEPKFYAPIIPMILVNGVVGIGTGYSTTIPPCNPRDIYENLLRINDGLKPKPMTPWYRNFKGTVEKIDKTNFIIRAKYKVVDDDTIHISDLPIGVWTDNYKAFLDNIILGATKAKKSAKETEIKKPAPKKGKGGSKARAPKKDSKKSNTAKVAKSNTISQYVKSFTEDCTNVRVSFTIIFHPGKLNELIKNGKLEKDLKLQKTVKLSNMHLFNEEGKVIKYSNYGAILNNFSRVRIEMYQTRKDHLLGKWRHECDILKWKMKFIDSVIDGTIIIFEKNKTKKMEVIKERLKELEFPKFMVGAETKPTYKYITSTGLFSLTTEEVERLRQMLENKEEDIQTLEGKTTNEMWSEELETFMKAYDKWEKIADEEYAKEMVDNSKKTAKKRQTKKVVKKKEAVASA
uniref:DNA topoisomerase (ATP-hydrolyzing) n=1 Tax=viral metagenome TaxID=1070528 RepID=A0A6C0CBD7_9ZZZZ